MKIKRSRKFRGQVRPRNFVLESLALGVVRNVFCGQPSGTSCSEGLIELVGDCRLESKNSSTIEIVLRVSRATLAIAGVVPGEKVVASLT